jgi:hypothetical protein
MRSSDMAGRNIPPFHPAEMKTINVWSGYEKHNCLFFIILFNETTDDTRTNTKPVLG